MDYNIDYINGRIKQCLAIGKAIYVLPKAAPKINPIPNIQDEKVEDESITVDDIVAVCKNMVTVEDEEYHRFTNSRVMLNVALKLCGIEEESVQGNILRGIQLLTSFNLSRTASMEFIDFIIGDQYKNLRELSLAQVENYGETCLVENPETDKIFNIGRGVK